MMPTYPLNATCLWLAIDVQFIRDLTSGMSSSSLWRAVIKDSLLQSNPQHFEELFEPMRFRKLDTHVDCPGILIEAEMRGGYTRIHLKFLGAAARFSAACLLALESKLRSGVGQQLITGFILSINAWNGHDWAPISMPVLASDLDKWQGDPAALMMFGTLKPSVARKGTLHISTRTHWMVRSEGVAVKKAPDLPSILKMIEHRAIRIQTAWGHFDRRALADSCASALEASRSFRCIEQSWQFVRTSVAGRYPSDGSRGYLIFEGEMTNELLYWLYAGSFWLIGQQTSLGLGGYEVHFKPAKSDAPP